MWSNLIAFFVGLFANSLSIYVSNCLNKTNNKVKEKKEKLEMAYKLLDHVVEDYLSTFGDLKKCLVSLKYSGGLNVASYDSHGMCELRLILSFHLDAPLEVWQKMQAICQERSKLHGLFCREEMILKKEDVDCNLKMLDEQCEISTKILLDSTIFIQHWLKEQFKLISENESKVTKWFKCKLRNFKAKKS